MLRSHHFIQYMFIQYKMVRYDIQNETKIFIRILLPHWTFIKWLIHFRPFFSDVIWNTYVQWERDAYLYDFNIAQPMYEIMIRTKSGYVTFTYTPISGVKQWSVDSPSFAFWYFTINMYKKRGYFAVVLMI